MPNINLEALTNDKAFLLPFPWVEGYYWCSTFVINLGKIEKYAFLCRHEEGLKIYCKA